MNDGTTSAPEIEAHMTLEHDISSSKDSLAPPSSVVPLGVAQGNELDGLTLPGSFNYFKYLLSLLVLCRGVI